MNKLAVIVVAPLSLVCACSNDEDRRREADAELILEAEDEIRKSTLDPEAVKFRNQRVTIYAAEGKGVRRVVCGEYNGKNAYGAYVGFTEFQYDTVSEELTVPEEGSLACM
jgi:hypothetical protein